MCAGIHRECSIVEVGCEPVQCNSIYSGGMLKTVCEDDMVHCIEGSTEVEKDEDGTVTGVSGEEEVILDF